MLSRTRIRSVGLALALLAPALSACDNKTLVGTYAATSFTYAPAGSTAKDVLAAGGSIHMVVANDMTTSGTMVIPASVTGSGEVSVSLLGTAGKSGDLVNLNLAADTFLRDMDFTFDGTTLIGTGTFSGVTVVLTLSK